MTKREIRAMARREAGAWLAVDADANDLDDSLTEEEQDAVREEIRAIAERLARRGRPSGEGGR